jgi:hypothetical protein
MREAAALTSCLLIAGFVGCGVQDSDDVPFTITDSAGVRIIESRLPTWGVSERRINPDPLVRIGQLEGDERYEFGQLTDGIFLSDGQIAVSDILAHQVRVFDSSGRHVNTFGREGEGPGAFRSVGHIWEYRGDSIAAFDQRLYRTNVFSRSSGRARTIGNPMEGNFVVFGLLSAGRFLLLNPGQPRYLPPGQQWDSTDVVSVDLSGGSVDTIIRLPLIERLIGPGGRREPLMLRGVSISAVAEDGFYWATSDRYEIRFYDAAGRVRRILRRPIRPRKIDESLKVEYKVAFNADVRRLIGEEAARGYLVPEEAVFAESIPLFRSAFVDGDQRLWVSEWPWPSELRPPRRWSVFSPEGFWLGDLEAPDGVRIVDSRREIVLGIWRDELDVEYVQLHRVVGN